MERNERGRLRGLSALLFFFIALILVPISVLGQSLPKLREAQAPPLPPRAAGGGEVLLELEVGADGRVKQVRVLRTTPPYAELLTQAVTGWSFEPARGGEEEGPVPSRVLVAGVFRGPGFYAGTSPGTPPRDADQPSSAVAYPENIVEPVYPARAYGDGVVLLELEVDVEGQIQAIRSLTSGTGFEQAAIDAARRWTFRPARPTAHGSGDSLVVVVFGFPRPVIPSR
ncbi:MAG: TonB family protein [Vicinamibacteria bacterium]